MNSPAISVSQAPEYPNPLARADALEREITDLCAQINAAGVEPALAVSITGVDSFAPVTSCSDMIQRTGKFDS